MIYNIRLVGLKDLVNPLGITNRSYQHHQIHFRVLSLKLLLDIVGIVLIYIKDNKLLGLMSRNLSAQLRADGSAATCHHHNLAAYIACNGINVNSNGISSKKVLYLHITES